MHLVVDFLIGTAIGAFAGLFGVGGGIVAIPLFVLAFGYTQVIAQRPR